MAGKLFKCKRCGESVAVPNVPPAPRDSARRPKKKRVAARDEGELHNVDLDEFADAGPSPAPVPKKLRMPEPEPVSAPVPAGLGNSLEERVLERARMAEAEAGDVPVKTLAVAALLMILAAILLGMNLGWGREAEIFKLTFGGIPLFAVVFVAAMVVVGFAIFQWIASAQSRD